MIPAMRWGNELAVRVSILGAVALIVACTRADPDLPATVRPAGSPAAEFRPVTDIPIPEDASLDTERSLILSSRDRWTGRVVMKVGMSAAKAFAFYQQEMPNFRWIPIMSVQSEISVLAFTRDDRAATVQVQRRTIGGALITITIAPRQADRPVKVQPVR